MLRARILLLPTLLFAFAATALGEDKKTHDAITPASREGGWIARHESFNKRVAEGKVDVIFIGDSITQGWEGTGKITWEKFYGKRNAVNLGISGDRTQHVMWRLDNGNVKDISPKVAVVMIGTNNAGANTPEQIADGVTAIVKQLREKLPETKVLLLGVFPRGADDQNGARQVNQKANAIFAKLDDGEHVHYLDIGPNFLDDNGVLTKEIMPDLLHLSEKGYAIWAESIEEKLAKLLGE